MGSQKDSDDSAATPQDETLEEVGGYRDISSSRSFLQLSWSNLRFAVLLRCRGFVTRACRAARYPSQVLQACKAAERRRVRRVLTQYLCLHLWPFSNTACCSRTHRTTRWGELGHHRERQRKGRLSGKDEQEEWEKSLLQIKTWTESTRVSQFWVLQRRVPVIWKVIGYGYVLM